MSATAWGLALLAGLAVALAAAHVAYAAWVRRSFPPATSGGVTGIERRGAGRTVLFLHGMNGTARDFPEALLEDLARDHSVLALDRPGHAGSARGDGPLDLAANARAVLTALGSCGNGPAVLVGHSYGAAVALRAALDAPERVSAVVLLSPCTVVDERNARYADLPLSGFGRRAALQLLTLPGGALTAPRTRREAWAPAPVPAGLSYSRAWALVPAQLDASLENFRTLRPDLARLAADLPRLAMPLDVLVGAADAITPWRLHAAWLPGLVPGAKLHVFEGVGHWLPRQCVAEVAAAVRRAGTAR